MTTWRRKLARSAWTALLLLFAVRAIAGPALCQIYGEHPVPHGSMQASTGHGHGHGQPGPGSHSASAIEHQSPSAHPSNGNGDHVCEEQVFLTSQATPASALKWSFAHDAIAWFQAPVGPVRPPVDAADVPRQKQARPPPSLAPLEIAPRLRI